MKLIIERVFSITKEHSFHPKWKVRFATVTSAGLKGNILFILVGLLASQCKETLCKSIPLLLDSIVLHIHDDHLPVRQESKRFLNQLSCK